MIEIKGELWNYYTWRDVKDILEEVRLPDNIWVISK